MPKKDLYGDYFGTKSSRKKGYPILLKHFGRTEFIILDALRIFAANKTFKRMEFTTSELVEHFKHTRGGKGTDISKKRIIQCLNNLNQDNIIRRAIDNKKGKLFRRNHWQIDFEVMSAIEDIVDIQEHLEATKSKDIYGYTKRIITTIDPKQLFSEDVYPSLISQMKCKDFICLGWDKLSKTQAIVFETNIFDNFFSIALTFELVKNSQIHIFSWKKQDFTIIEIEVTYSSYHEEKFQSLGKLLGKGGKVITPNNTYPSLINYLKFTRKCDFESIFEEWLSKVIDGIFLSTLDILSKGFEFDILVPEKKGKRENIIDYFSWDSITK